MNNTKQTLILIVLIATIGMIGCDQKDHNNMNKLTGINPLAYTDVVYISSRDTVIVSTYSGRIAQRIKGQTDELIIAQLADEIYSLAYSKKRSEIFVTTLESGILILNAKTGAIIKSLEVDK